MIEVEFRRPTGRGRYSAAAVLRIDDAGRVTIEGDERMVDTSVPIADLDAPDGEIRFDRDPVRWVRNAHRAFRTPYLVPVVTRDDSVS